MIRHVTLAIVSIACTWSMASCAGEEPYITTKTPLTLLSANDGESDILWRRTEEGLIDYSIKTKDSFTVIRLGPDHPPICKTVYGTVPCTIAGTPTMAMTSDGRYGLITNHGFRPKAWGPIKHATSEPVTNDDTDDATRPVEQLASPLSNMISMIDLGSPDFAVIHRVFFEDHPAHVLAHPDGKHFVVGGSENYYVFKIQAGKLVEVSRSHHGNGFTCFWINPAGDRIIATQGNLDNREEPAAIHWYSFSPQQVRHLSKVEVQEGTDTQLLPDSYILRISLDGKKAFVCQNSSGDAGVLCDIPIVDLTKDPPVINSVIKQVADTVESFAFHPNGKMAVVTCASWTYGSIAVLDIQPNPPRLLYYLDTGGIAQGIEFTPDGDKLFVGSPVTSRIDVFDVVGDFDLRKSQMFLKTGNGHCSLTLGRTWGK